jgi:methylase of polypeptide subunit release factors
VLGIGGASVTLAQATVRPHAGTALDLGTGCGVQALHLSRHTDAVTVTDVSDRALRFAATTAALNGMSWEYLAGDLVAPVAGRRFDLVVSNPPFIVGPPLTGADRMVYRDSGREGDGISAELIAALPGLLNPGGHAQLLANWMHVKGRPWEERVGAWLAETGLDAHAVQREALDPAGYVALWLRDAGELGGPNAARRTAEWLDWFATNRVEAVGFGLVSLHAAGAASATVRVEEAMQEHDTLLGPEVLSWFERVAFLRGADLLRSRLVAAPALRLRQTAELGEDDWEVDQQILALEAGWRWSQEVDPVTVALVGGCDGSARLGDQLAVLAAAYEADPAAFAAVAIPLVSRLVEHGMLLPASEG